MLRSPDERALLNINVKKVIGDRGKTMLRHKNGVTSCHPWVAPLIEALNGNELELADELTQALDARAPTWHDFIIEYPEAK